MIALVVLLIVLVGAGLIALLLGPFVPSQEGGVMPYQKLSHPEVIEIEPKKVQHLEPLDDAPQTEADFEVLRLLGEVLPENSQSSVARPGILDLWWERRRASSEIKTNEVLTELKKGRVALITETEREAEAIVSYIATLYKSGKLSRPMVARLRQKLPLLMKNLEQEERIHDLENDVKVAELEKKLSELRRTIGHSSRFSERLRQWREVMDQKIADLRGVADGATTLAKELKSILLSIENDGELSDEEKKRLIEAIRQEFLNIMQGGR